MPSLDFFKSGPATEQLRIESEPPGADARTSQGQTCRTPCELTVPSGGELAVTVPMNGYQPQTMPVRADGKGGLQPNPVYVELLPAAPPPKPAKPAPRRKEETRSRRGPPAPRAQTQAAAPPRATAPIRHEPRLSLAAGAAIGATGRRRERGNLGSLDALADIRQNSHIMEDTRPGAPRPDAGIALQPQLRQRRPMTQGVATLDIERPAGGRATPWSIRSRAPSAICASR